MADRARVAVVRLEARSSVLLAVTSVLGLAAFGWPLDNRRDAEETG